MLRIGIIDDEENARFLIKEELIAQYGNNITIVFEGNSVASGIDFLNNHRIDILFLDIKLSDGTGFQILETINQVDFEVVFVTAFNDFALRAFDFFAFAYLVKPFKTSELCRIVEKYLETRQKSSLSTIRILSESINDKSIKKIVLSDLDGFKVIRLSDIVYVMSDNNYSEFFIEGGDKIVSSKTLKDYERTLEEEHFFRCHRRYLINLSKVNGYSKVDGGYVSMSNGDEVPIGRRRLRDFRQKFLA